jgi:hypothetical protein
MPYLERATDEEARKQVDIGSGILWDKSYRPIFPCIVKSNEFAQANWGFLIVDSGSPFTFLFAQVSFPIHGIITLLLIKIQACDILKIKTGPAPVTVTGYRHTVLPSPEDSHFRDVNLLGYVCGE